MCLYQEAAEGCKLVTHTDGQTWTGVDIKAFHTADVKERRRDVRHAMTREERLTSELGVTKQTDPQLKRPREGCERGSVCRGQRGTEEIERKRHEL